VGAFYVANEYWFAVFQLVLAMLGMGATLTLKDFRDLVNEPRPVTLGIFVQLVLVPLATLLFLRALGIEGGVAIGLAVLAAVPGGTVSNIFTFFARGNTALSICITGITTLACLLTTPLILALLITEYMPADFQMPRARIVTEIALTLLLPLALGMLYLYLYPATARTLSKWSIRGSLLGLLFIVVGSLAAGRINPEQFGLYNIAVVHGYALALIAVAVLAPRLLGLSRRDSTAIEIEVIVRNIGLAVMIKASMFPATTGPAAQVGDMVLFTLIIYGGFQLLVGGILVGYYRRRRVPAD